MSDQVSGADKVKAQLKAFVHSTNIDEITRIDTESERALTKVKNKARNFEGDTYTEFNQRRSKRDGTVRVTVDLPQELHREFKILAAELETDMNALLTRMVEKLVSFKNR